MIGETVNWMLILLGISIGAIAGFSMARFITWFRRMKAGLRLALPVIRMAGYAGAALLVIAGFSLVWIGVL